MVLGQITPERCDLSCEQVMQLAQKCDSPCKQCCPPQEYPANPSLPTGCQGKDCLDFQTGCCESAEGCSECCLINGVAEGRPVPQPGDVKNPCGCYGPGYTSDYCPQKPPGPPPHKPPQPFFPPPNPPPSPDLGGQLINYVCSPCEDGHIPSTLTNCNCGGPGGCQCGPFYCACQYEQCLTAAEQNPLEFPGLTGIIGCLNALGACEKNPPPCPTNYSKVITQISCLPCCNGQTPQPPECACAACCPPNSHAAPCAIGECLDLGSGCCSKCGGCMVGECLNLTTGVCEACDSGTPPPPITSPAALRASAIMPPAFMLPSANAGSDFLAATAAIGA